MVKKKSFYIVFGCRSFFFVYKRILRKENSVTEQLTAKLGDKSIRFVQGYSRAETKTKNKKKKDFREEAFFCVLIVLSTLNNRNDTNSDVRYKGNNCGTDQENS